MATVNDLSSRVLYAVENRSSSTDTTNSYQWIRDAVLELANNPDFRNDFPELEVKGPTFALTAKTQEYTESNLINANDVMDGTLDIILWTDFPTNSIWIKLTPSHYQRTDMSFAANAQSTEWYRFGGSIGFNPPPDQNYQVQARYLRKHPFSSPIASTDAILLPADWEKVIELLATAYGFMSLEQYQKSSALRVFLFGDPSKPDSPGFIRSRKTKREKEQHRTTYPLRPIVKQMSHRVR